MLINVLLVLVVLVVVFLIYVARQPKAFRITRGATVSAPPAVAFAQVNDFHAWLAWSPWEKLDPALKRTYAGPDSGVGASYAWEGNNKVGSGRMTILENRPAELIRIKLEFLKPFAATNTAEFTFAPESEGRVRVTWSMAGEQGNLFCRAMCVFMNMDKMVGGQFEQGLANLDAVVRAKPRG